MDFLLPRAWILYFCLPRRFTGRPGPVAVRQCGWKWAKNGDESGKYSLQSYCFNMRCYKSEHMMLQKSKFSPYFATGLFVQNHNEKIKNLDNFSPQRRFARLSWQLLLLFTGVVYFLLLSRFSYMYSFVNDPQYFLNHNTF